MCRWSYRAVAQCVCNYNTLSLNVLYSCIIPTACSKPRKKEESVVAESNHSDDSGENSGCM